MAVAQHRNAVGDAGEFLEPVGNVDDADAVRAQFADHAHEMPDLLLRERGRGLVHDEDARIRAERARDFHELLLGHRESAGFGVGVNARADPLQQCARALPSLVPAHALPCAALLQPERDIFRHGQLGEKRRLLVDRRDAAHACRDGIVVKHALARDLKDARVRPMRAGDDFDECGFPRAILADQRMHFPRVQVERNALERAHSGEGFANVGGAEQIAHKPDGCRSERSNPGRAGVPRAGFRVPRNRSRQDRYDRVNDIRRVLRGTRGTAGGTPALPKGPSVLMIAALTSPAAAAALRR